MHIKIYDKILKFIKENLWFFIALMAVFLLFNVTLPYEVEIPGGYISLNDRVKVENESKVTGDLGMAYVSMIKGSIPFILYSYINADWDTIKKDDITYNNESIAEMNEREKLYMNEAVATAKYVAFQKAQGNVEISNTKLYVAYLDNDDTELKTFDIIKDIDGQEVNSLKDIQNIIENTKLNKVSVGIIRNDTYLKVSSSIQNIDGVNKIGIIVIPNYDVDTNPTVNIDTKDNESGPSGGLMMTLSIYEKLTGIDLTHGDKIIGTGTISLDGSVGEIGGIKYKLIGAVNNKAKVFLCPKENYEEAINLANERHYDIIIKDVANFDEAVNYLRSR